MIDTSSSPDILPQMLMWCLELQQLSYDSETAVKRMKTNPAGLWWVKHADALVIWQVPVGNFSDLPKVTWLTGKTWPRMQLSAARPGLFHTKGACSSRAEVEVSTLISCSVFQTMSEDWMFHSLLKDVMRKQVK